MPTGTSTLSTGQINTGLHGVAAGVQIVGSVMLGLAQIEQGKAVKKRLDQEARQIELIGLLNARKRRIEGQRLIGAQIAAFSKSGVAAGFGSALDIELRTRALEELAALEEQLPFRIRASDIRRQGKLAKQGARGQGIKTIMQGVSRAIDGIPVGESDTPPADTDPIGRTGDTLVPRDYRAIAPVVSEGEMLASMSGNRIRQGGIQLMDLAPEQETLGVGGTA